MGCCGSKEDPQQAFQDFTTSVEQKSNKGTELQHLGENISNVATSYQPNVPKRNVNNAELQAFTQELLEKDFNNVTPFLKINHQGYTNYTDTDDKAPDPLLTIPREALSGPTIKAFMRLLNNYDPNVAAIDWATAEETQQQNMFLDAIMQTQVMKYTEKFLNNNGIIQRPLKDVLKEMWFTTYSRTGGNEGSSGFEHVFIGEIKDKKVMGMHNWIQFGNEERGGNLDYKGIMKYVDLGSRGQVIKGRFEWLNQNKPVGTLFVGTSPEFEMALYTVCFLVKPDKKCEIKLNNKKFNIQTHSLKWNKKLLGDACPEI